MASNLGKEPVWGADAAISLPQPLKTTNTDMVDMDGFCFTPNGIRINMSATDREDLVSRGFGPDRSKR